MTDERGAILEISNVHTFYGTIEALKGISIEVHDGEIVTLIGANGAGKSTTLRSVNGLNHPRTGTITFMGEDITSKPAHEIVRMGISQSPEGRKLFPRMTVVENLEMGAFQRSDQAEIKEDMEHVFTLFPRLAERKSQKAGTMSGGEQQMCAIGRAMMARPKLLMLDEPSMGLAPIFVERIFETVVAINNEGTPILLVEQNALMALDVAKRAYVHGDRPDRARGTCERAEDERAGSRDLPGRRLGPDEKRRVRWRQQDADASPTAREPVGHLECTRDGVARDEAEGARRDGISAARDEDAAEARERRAAAGPVRVGQERVANPSGPVLDERALVLRRRGSRTSERRPRRPSRARRTGDGTGRGARVRTSA